MDKKAVVQYTMEYYSAIKKNAFELVLMRWMKLEPILQSEVSQKHQYSILSLFLTFTILMFLVECPFGFILFGTLWAPWTWAFLP